LGSTDPFPNGAIATYAWNWGDGSPASTTASPSHTYAAAGPRTITLRVSDSYGQLKSIAVNITVN
jgi:PKD repeat protein